jgi:hypothetical protein
MPLLEKAGSRLPKYSPGAPALPNSNPHDALAGDPGTSDEAPAYSGKTGGQAAEGPRSWGRLPNSNPPDMLAGDARMGAGWVSSQGRRVAKMAAVRQRRAPARTRPPAKGRGYSGSAGSRVMMADIFGGIAGLAEKFAMCEVLHTSSDHGAI